MCFPVCSMDHGLQIGCAMAKDVVRVAAVGDLHCTRTSQGAFQPLFAQIAEVRRSAGPRRRPDRSRPARRGPGPRPRARDASACRPSPYSATTTSNPDQQDEVRQILAGCRRHRARRRRRARSRDRHRRGQGVRRRVRPAARSGRGASRSIKQFVHEAVNEALKLEAALARLRTPPASIALHALLADPADRRGRAAGDLPVPRLAAGSRSRSTAIR